MKQCPKCMTTVEDDCVFCVNCGEPLSQPNPANNQQPPMGAGAPPMGGGYGPVPPQPPIYQADPFDHTAEFDPQDISDNKAYAMLPYLMGVFGIVIALLARKDSKYLEFHLRQAIKFEVVSILLGIIAVIGSILIIPGIAAGIMAVVILVIRVITFFQVCKGEAKEPAIIRSLSFLK